MTIMTQTGCHGNSCIAIATQYVVMETIVKQTTQTNQKVKQIAISMKMTMKTKISEICIFISNWLFFADRS